MLLYQTRKEGYLTLNISFKKEGKIMIRSSSGINKWFSLIKSLSQSCNSVQQQSTKDFWSGKKDTNNVDNWLLERQFFDKKSKKSNPKPKPINQAPAEFHSPYFHHQIPQPQPQFQSLHNIWPEMAVPVPVHKKPVRNINRRMRPKSCIELTGGGGGDTKMFNNIRSEDSGNSSMSTSTPRSVRK